MRTTVFIHRTRLVVFSAGVLVLFALVSGRLFFLHIVEREHARNVIAESRFRFQEIQPRRGMIMDANGQVLATSRPAWEVGVDPQVADVRDKEKLGALAALIGVSQEQLEARFGWDAEQIRTLERRRWIKLADAVDEPTMQAIDALEIDGVYGNRHFQRFYPFGSTAVHVVGFLNRAHDPVLGIEHTLDFYLRGSPGWRVREVSGTRREIRQFRVRDIDAQDGLSIQLTLDASIQHAVEQELDRLVHELSPESASIIVSNPRTGAVLAMGSRPTLDPNHFWDYDLNRVLRNSAIGEIYEPGSTFKVITAAAFMNEGIGDRDTLIDCSTQTVYHHNRRVRLPSDIHPRGTIPFHEIIRRSSNRGAALAGLKLGDNRFYEYCRAFGIGQRSGLELTGEERGIFTEPQNWDHYTLSRLAIGYGVGVTPLQTHLAMSVIANDGFAMQPRLVKGALDADGYQVLSFEQSEPRAVIDHDIARELRNCLVEAVSLGGTGNRAVLRSIQVAGKTGTSRILTSDGYSEDHHVASFSGFFPAEFPEYVITVVVNDPKGSPSNYGGRVAAPAFRNLAQYIVASRGIQSASEDPRLVLNTNHRL